MKSLKELNLAKAEKDIIDMRKGRVLLFLVRMMLLIAVLVILYYLVKERITGTDNEHTENVSIEIPDSWRGLI